MFIENELLKNYCGCGECCRNYKSKGEECMNSWLTRDQSETLHVSRQFSLKHSRFWAGLSRPLHRMGSMPLSITQSSCLFCSANCLNYNYKKLARLSLDGALQVIPEFQVKHRDWWQGVHDPAIHLGQVSSPHFWTVAGCCLGDGPGLPGPSGSAKVFAQRRNHRFGDVIETDDALDGADLESASSALRFRTVITT